MSLSCAETSVSLLARRLGGWFFLDAVIRRFAGRRATNVHPPPSLPEPPLRLARPPQVRQLDAAVRSDRSSPPTHVRRPRGFMTAPWAPTAPNVTGLGLTVARFSGSEKASRFGGPLLRRGRRHPVWRTLIVDEHSFGWIPRRNALSSATSRSGLDPADATVLYAVQQGLSMSAVFEDVSGETLAW